MNTQTSRGAQLLRCAPSRTRTARAPIGNLLVSAVSGFPSGNVAELYAGPPQVPPENPRFPGHTVNLPFADSAVQMRARLTSQIGVVLLLIDLGRMATSRVLSSMAIRC
jgi:hypothetical protein